MIGEGSQAYIIILVELHYFLCKSEWRITVTFISKVCRRRTHVLIKDSSEMYLPVVSNRPFSLQYAIQVCFHGSYQRAVIMLRLAWFKATVYIFRNDAIGSYCM